MYGAFVLDDSLPVATCWPVVDSVIALLQTPELPPVTLLHVTVTADVGTVAQLVKEVAAACTLRVQLLLVDPPEVFQVTVEAELPDTLPRSGSVDAKLMLVGLAVTVPTVAASGTAAGIMVCGFCPPPTWAAPRHAQSPASASGALSCSADRIGNRRRVGSGFIGRVICQ